jgi:alkylation response protein AidB-like acyl-CoA dehydrogenase
VNSDITSSLETERHTQMDFSIVELSDDDKTFYDATRQLLNSLVTPQVLREDRETGDNFNEDVHLALGAHGYLGGDLKPESEGGFDPVRRRIWDLETRRVQMPYFHWSLTQMVARAVQKFASDDVKTEVLERVYSGEIRLCLGYTEPDGGSDVATCKTKAVRDGDDWIINGQKIFTTGAHNSQYVFLLTNTDPAGPKHKNLTMFLVPLQTPGIEIQPVRTIDGDRTNIVFYTDVRVGDRYRMGEINGGWTVIRSALDEEHAVGDRSDHGLEDFCGLGQHAALIADAIDNLLFAAGRPDAEGRRLLDEHAVGYRLGRSIALLEAALSSPGEKGRVAVAEAMRAIAPDLMDLQGAASTVPVANAGHSLDQGAEHLFRLSGPTGVYGGTVEVYRNIIAQHTLGMGRPAYSRPATT